MGRSRALTALASVAVMLAAMVGIALTSTAASATRGVRYPPPPPSLMVDRGVVKVGVTVRATGRTFRARERVSIVVRFTPKGSHRSRIIRVSTVYADRKGRIYVSIRTGSAGSIVITATGRSSRTSASASVFVIDKRKYGRGHHRMWPAAFTGAEAGIAAPKTVAAEGNVSGSAIAGLAVMFMAGSALVAYRADRRRRKAGTTAH